MGALQWPRLGSATVAATDPAATSSARSAAASSGGGWRSTQVGGYAPETRPTSRQHQLQPQNRPRPPCCARWIYLRSGMPGLAIYCPSSSDPSESDKGIGAYMIRILRGN